VLKTVETYTTTMLKQFKIMPVVYEQSVTDIAPGSAGEIKEFDNLPVLIVELL